MAIIHISIGKAPDNQCVISNPTVSKYHAELTIDESNPGTGLITDKNSTNGTYVNGKKITQPTQVNIGDKIHIGSQETNIADIMAKSKNTRVVVSHNNGGKSIGRSPNCDIVIKAPDISSNHAKIWKDSAGNIVIEDNRSTNGTYVNGMKITSKVLHKGDRVTLGGNNYLDWESIFPENPEPPKTSENRIWVAAAAVAVILLIGVGGYWIIHNRKWDKEKIYATYSDTVCLVLADYGYKVKVGDNDMTQKLFGSPIISVDENGKLQQGTSSYTGTAFFISEDGKLATNLHMIKPWLFEESVKKLTQDVREFFAQMGTMDPRFTAMVPDVKVEGELQNLYIVPNGLPVTQGNAINCTILKSGNDVENDIAVIQTENRKLPKADVNVLSLDAADLTTDAIKQGKTIFTIGYPYGLGIGLIEGKELQNQVHEGAVTQERGEYEFGHDAATAGGASGSPIINDKGKLVGIHHAGLTGVTGAQGFNRAIKVKHLKTLMNQ